VFAAPPKSIPKSTPTSSPNRVGKQQLRGHLLAAVQKLKPVAPLSTTTNLELAIGLPLRNGATLQNFLKQISDPNPKNAWYGKYLTPAVFKGDHSPTQKDYDAVIAFAKAKGLTVRNTFANRVVVSVSGSAQNIQNAFYVKLNTYKRPDGSVFHAPDREPSLDLTTPVLHISGLDNYVRPVPNVKPTVTPSSHGQPVPNGGTGPGGLFGGADFRKAYAPGISLKGANQSLGLFELSSGFYAADITRYKNQFKLTNVPVQTVLLDGFNGSPSDTTYANSNLEVPLDIEVAIAMAPGLSHLVVFEGAQPNSILAAMASPPPGVPLCRQLSASWNFSVDSNSQQLFDQMAAQGQTFFAASGDFGAYTSNTGDDRDCDQITVVGGTVLNMAGNGVKYQSEDAWTGSGGGIESAGIPYYQGPVNMSLNGGSTSSRDLPDVSAIATNVSIYFGNGQQTGVVGTSIATPIWAGYMALVHEAQQQKGNLALGFINPTLYFLGQSKTLYPLNFHDIKDNVFNGHYRAVAGYDLVTGWGSPTAHLISAMAPSPRTAYSNINFVVGTGGDDARNDSTVTATLRAPGSHQTIQSFVLKAKNAGSWGNNSTHAVPFAFNDPIAAQSLGDVVISLGQGGHFPETADNWNLQSLVVELFNPGQGINTVMQLKGNPLKRLTGSNGSVTFTFPR